MVTKRDKMVFALIVALAVGAFFLLRASRPVSAAIHDEAGAGHGKKRKGKKEKSGSAPDAAVTITQRWDMPEDLREISGIAALPEGRFACVQDELGKIYIFNTKTSQVEREISFGEPGDYEDIAIAGSTAYVVRSDGKVFEIAGYAVDKPVLTVHNTFLTAKQDVEGLCYDAANNRLLLAIKGKDPDADEYKGIYAFDLNTKKLNRTPAYKIGLSGAGSGKTKVQPSAIGLQPGTGDIYIVEGPSSKLIILGSDGNIKSEFQLGRSDFPQPEGLAFTQSGELYISNEGGNGAGNILKVSVDAR